MGLRRCSCLSQGGESADRAVSGSRKFRVAAVVFFLNSRLGPVPERPAEKRRLFSAFYSCGTLCAVLFFSRFHALAGTGCRRGPDILGKISDRRNRFIALYPFSMGFRHLRCL